MEDVWKDINFSTLGQDSCPPTPSLSIEAPQPHRRSSASGGRNSLHGTILQDFLAGAFKEPPCPASAADGLSQLPLPPTFLCLSSSGFGRASDFPPVPSSSNSDSSYLAAATGRRCGSDDIADLRSPTGAVPDQFFWSKNPSNAGVDHRLKRMIKNRESAARSRARKLAYKRELEQKVAFLSEENSELKKQNDKLRTAMVAPRLERKAHQRTSSAPF